MGYAKWFDGKKGFGFIESQGKDYFVHFRSIEGMGYKELQDGQLVTFVPKMGDKGIMASEVRIV